jgi:putative endonuclease
VQNQAGGPWRSRKGAYYEAQALSYLRGQGLTLVQANYRCKLGEIDLVMQDIKGLIFVEVRYRCNPSHGSAIATVDYWKQQKLRNAARQFLLYHRLHERVSCRFDVIGLETTAGGNTSVQWIKNAFY